MIQRTFVLLLFFLCNAWAYGVPRPEGVPAVLLAAPVNAAWASAHMELWKEKGIGGFLLSGVVDGLDEASAAPDRMASLRDETGALVSEVKMAHSRLAAGGVGENYCLAPLSPDLPYFTDPETAARAIGVLAAASEFCAKTGLKGIAFDTRSGSLFFDYRWDGYEYKNYAPESLCDGARDFGRRCGRAMVKNLPNADIILITDSMRSWRPLYVAYFGGLLEGFHGGRNGIHLLTRETFFETDAARITETATVTRNVLRGRLSGRARDTWEKRGAVALGMCPLGYRDEAGQRTPAANYDAAAFRRQVAAAKTWSDRYVWLEAAGPLWWQVSDEEKAIYSGVLQNGPLLKNQTEALPAEFAAYTAACRLDPLRRAGPFPFKDNACFVFDSEEGAAAFFSDGVASDIVVGVEGPRVRVTNMATGERQTLTGSDGQVRIEKTHAPILVDPLPVRQWVPAAGLWLTMRDPPTPDADRAPVQYGFVNRTFSDLSASVNAALPSGFSLNPGHFDQAELAPLAKIEANATLRGRFAAGATIAASVTCVMGGGLTESRPYTIHVSPNLIWQCETDGRMPSGVAVADMDRSGTTDFLAATEAGDVVRIAADGAVRWRKRFPATFASGPVCGRDGAGNAYIVLSDTTGKLTALGELGDVLWQCDAGAVGQIVCEDLDGAGGDEIVCARNDGGVAAFRANGEVLWKIDGVRGRSFLCRGSRSVFMTRACEKNTVE
jgi:hypothetical protein